MRKLPYPTGIAGADRHADQGPTVLKSFLKEDHMWEHIDMSDESHPDSKNKKIIHNLHQLKRGMDRVLKDNKRFCVVGGDHSSAMATWASASDHYHHQIGLIWIDAHMDAHTHQTSHSQNVHGMPVAALLGHGQKSLVNLVRQAPAIKPEQLCLIGIRDYQEAERQLIEDMNIRVYYATQVHERGIGACMQEAIDYLLHNNAYFGMSIDIDGFDPEHCPAVSTPSPGGINPYDFIAHLTQWDKTTSDRLIGIEIAEFNPMNDVMSKSLHVISKIIQTLEEKMTEDIYSHP